MGLPPRPRGDAKLSFFLFFATIVVVYFLAKDFRTQDIPKRWYKPSVKYESPNTVANGGQERLKVEEEARAERPIQVETDTSEPKEKYLWLLDGKEGIASWRYAISELLIWARELNRTLVEPCVKDGQLVPCCPNMVYDLNKAVDEQGTDAYFNHPTDMMFRLSAYIDLEPLRQIARIVPFDTFIETVSLEERRHLNPFFMSAGDDDVVPKRQRTIMDMYRFDRQTNRPEKRFNPVQKICPDMTITDLKFPNLDLRPFQPTNVLAIQNWANQTRDLPYVAFLRYYRDRFRFVKGLRNTTLELVRNSTVRFQPRVIELANEIQRSLDLGESYLVFQWRTESIDMSHIPPCAYPAVDEIQCQMASGNYTGVLLVSDLPALENNRSMWVMADGPDARSKAAMSNLVKGANVKKIDSMYRFKDLGLQSIVDVILGERAAKMVSCIEPECDFCARTASRFARFIMELRDSKSKPYTVRWECNGPMNLAGLEAKVTEGGRK
eukprot:comp23324_c0_seq1/m.38408 comp23324_c0_seq1/g.38408  ORF comp23324_c0_seq1/g.38408 comp23324_c0_seq1/m.38408 type:complete len:495 (-) comp23324_c0_seq1:500-1984(-)